MLPATAEFKVEDDLVVGTVPFESLDESEVRKLAFERRRRSLKKGMMASHGWMSGHSHWCLGSGQRTALQA